MADPLSMAAGVAGLIISATQMIQVLSSTISKARHAPQSCHSVLIEVKDIRGILSQLEGYILGVNRASASRSSLIMLEQVVAILASCVMIFSDLDIFVEGVQSDATMGILDRLRWVSKENDLNATLTRLQSHKSSMNLMSMILTW